MKLKEVSGVTKRSIRMIFDAKNTQLLYSPVAQIPCLSIEATVIPTSDYL